VAEVVTSEDGLDYVQSASECETLFVLTEFEGDRYHKLHRAEARIIGPPVILGCKRNKQVGFWTLCFCGLDFESCMIAWKYGAMKKRIQSWKVNSEEVVIVRLISLWKVKTSR
jgi:hypothetical protein